MITSFFLLLLLSSSRASFINHIPAEGGFSIKQVAGGKRFTNGAVDLQKAHYKYTKRVPASIAAAAQAALQSGEVAANPTANDVEYISPVSIGTPAQVFNMVLDTGSADFWVCCSNLPASQQNGHTCYNPPKSSTSHQISGATFSLADGSGGTASGNVYYDKVVIGGVTASQQAIECASKESSSFSQNTDYDGFVGLAFSSINSVQPQKMGTFLQNIANTVPVKAIAAHLKKAAPGTFDIGFLDSKHYSGSITYVPIDKSQGYWSFTVGSYTIGTQLYTMSFTAIADTGTSLILLQDSIVSNYYNRIPNARNDPVYGGWVFPCNSVLPNLSFNIGGRAATVPGSYINFANANGASTCFGGLQSSGGIGINILGDVFIKSQYVVFDFGVPRIGFATQK